MYYNIKELSKEDSKWRGFALSICGDKSLADDLTQDMYLKLLDYSEIKNALVYRTLYTLFIDHVRRNKDFVLIDWDITNLTNDVRYEINDKEKSIIDSFYKLDWRQQELIIESYDKSYREINKSFPMIDYGYAYRQVHEGLSKVLGEDYKTKYVNKRNKHK